MAKKKKSGGKTTDNCKKKHLQMLKAKNLVAPVHNRLCDDMGKITSLLYHCDEFNYSYDKHPELYEYSSVNLVMVSLFDWLGDHISDTVAQTRIENVRVSTLYIPPYLKGQNLEGISYSLEMHIMCGLLGFLATIHAVDNHPMRTYSDVVDDCRKRIRDYLRKTDYSLMWSSSEAASHALTYSGVGALLSSICVEHTAHNAEGLIAQAGVLTWAIYSGAYKLKDFSRHFLYIMLFFLGDIQLISAPGDYFVCSKRLDPKECIGFRVGMRLVCDWIVDIYIDNEESDTIMQLGEQLKTAHSPADSYIQTPDYTSRVLSDIEDVRTLLHDIVCDVLCGTDREVADEWVACYLRSCTARRNTNIVDLHLYVKRNLSDPLKPASEYDYDKEICEERYYHCTSLAHQFYNSTYALIDSTYDVIPFIRQMHKSDEQAKKHYTALLQSETRVKELRHANSALKRQVDELQKAVDAKPVDVVPKSDFIALKEEHKRLRDVYGALSAKYDSQKSHIAVLQARESTSKANNEALEELETLEEYIAELEHKLESIEDDETEEWNINAPSQEDLEIMTNKRFLFYIPDGYTRLADLSRYFPNSTIDTISMFDTQRKTPSGVYDTIVLCAKFAPHSMTHRLKKVLGTKADLLYVTLSLRMETVAHEALLHYKHLHP